jgi:hypothetical protein
VRKPAASASSAKRFSASNSTRFAREAPSADTSRNRQAIAEGARDRHAEARAGRGDPKVACRRDRKSSADGKSLDDRQRRHRQRFDAAENAFHLLFIGDAVVAAAKSFELRDIGAGDEGLAPGAAKHRCAQPIFAAHPRAGLAELLVHVPRHGVARRGPVEDHRGDLTLAAQAHLSLAHRATPL